MAGKMGSFKAHVTGNVANWVRERADLSGGATETEALHDDYLAWAQRDRKRPLLTRRLLVEALKRSFPVYAYRAHNRSCLSGISLHTGAGQIIQRRRVEIVQVQEVHGRAAAADPADDII